MVTQDLATTMEDHALERVPDSEREKLAADLRGTRRGLVTTLVILFFGAVVLLRGRYQNRVGCRARVVRDRAAASAGRWPELPMKPGTRIH